MDLVCDEWTYPPERHAQAYNYANQNGLCTSGHFGEFGQNNYQNMHTGIHRLKSRRLEHAIQIAQYSDLVSWVSNNGKGVVMCPPSNLYCKFIKSVKDLRIKDLLEQQVLVSIGSDDPAMFGFTLSDGIDQLLNEGELSWEDIALLQLNAIDTSFIYGEERRQIRDRLVVELMRQLPAKTMSLVRGLTE
jgi:adenosine deaminase